MYVCVRVQSQPGARHRETDRQRESETARTMHVQKSEPEASRNRHETPGDDGPPSSAIPVRHGPPHDRADGLPGKDNGAERGLLRVRQVKIGAGFDAQEG